jgi:KipI family sensor histidine kinase inhibitor
LVVPGAQWSRRAFCFARRIAGAVNAGMTLSTLGDAAVVLLLGEQVDETVVARGHALAAEIERHAPRGVVEVVPAFASVAVFYDVARIGDFAKLCADLEALVTRADAAMVSDHVRRVVVPVCYGGEFGPDLDGVAALHGLSPAEVIGLHSGVDYLVHAIGFVPGFPYLGGLSEKLATPRRSTPRPLVAAGSVGIGGAQTGVYPLATPGGWNVIGRTPLAMFDAGRAEPALLRAGDHVKFRAIAADEFQRLAAAPAPPPGAAASPGRVPAPAVQPGVEVLRPGMLTTVQDLGRRGHRAQGVPLSGAADPFALRLANLLVGNEEDAAALEFTLIGPELRFLHDTVVALTGAAFEPLPRWEPVRIAAGTTLNFGPVREGCRGYLAIAGGIDVPPVLGSRSAYTRAAMGGLEGRPLRAGDRLNVPVVVPPVRGHWYVDPRILPAYSNSVTVRVVAGAQAGEFGDALAAAHYRVSPQSDRMGVRLSGESLRRDDARDLVSSPVAPGTVQVPPDGQPIILLADAQTIGGYPQIAHVISVDLPLVAQLRPGDRVAFRMVTLVEAHQLALAREHAAAMLREGLAQKLG